MLDGTICLQLRGLEDVGTRLDVEYLLYVKRGMLYLAQLRIHAPDIR